MIVKSALEVPHRRFSVRSEIAPNSKIAPSVDRHLQVNVK